MPVPVPYIDATGYHAPVFVDILAGLQADYRAIFGQDVYLEPDSQDGQWLAILAKAIADAFSVAAATYNSFSPSTAQGVGLSRVVKINGIQRKVPSYSTVDLRIIGQAGTQIAGGLVRDAGNHLWALPSLVAVPASGEVFVSATCVDIGAIEAPLGTVNQIATPTAGWQSATNIVAATPGAPVESDPDLRMRQSESTMLPSQTVLDGVVGAIAAVQDVSRLVVHENDTDTVDELGLPAHSVTAVVQGGDLQAIVDAIGRKKSPGTVTTGTTSGTYTDSNGIRRTIRFYRPTAVPITYRVRIKSQRGFTRAVPDEIRKALADWTNALQIGEDLQVVRSYVPAQLVTSVFGTAFELVSVQAARDGGVPQADDLALAFNEMAVCQASYIDVVVVA